MDYSKLAAKYSRSLFDSDSIPMSAREAQTLCV